MMMTLHALDSTFFALFLLLNLIVGLWYGRGVKSLRQYALGDRDFSTWVITMTIVATWMSGSAFHFHVWEAYARGLVEGGLGMGLLALSLLLLSLLALGAGECLGQATLPEVLGKAYGSTVRRITALAGALLCLAVVAMQFKIAGQALGGFLGLDQKKATFALGALVIAYSSLGGIRSVVFTDVLQFLLLGLFLPILVLALWSTLPEEAHYVAPSAGATRLFTLRGDLLGDLLIVLIVPPLFQRLQMARDVYQARRAFGYAALVWGLLSLFMLLLAVVLRMAQPDLTSEQLLPYLVSRASFPGFRGLVVSALMAMVMSTADSYLNTAVVWVAHDLLGTPPRAPHGLWRVRGVALTLGSLALGLALTDYGYGKLQSVVLNLSSALVLVPLLLHLVGFRSSQRAVLSGMSAGFLAFLLTGFLQLNPLGDNALAGILAHLLTLLGVHYLLGEAGGWVGVQEQEPLLQLRYLALHRWQEAKRWGLHIRANTLEGGAQPPGPGRYLAVGFYFLLAHLGMLFLLSAERFQAGGGYRLPLLVAVFLPCSLLITYPAWPKELKKAQVEAIGYPLLSGLLAFVIGPLLALLVGAPAQMLLATHLLIVSLLFSPWQVIGMAGLGALATHQAVQAMGGSSSWVAAGYSLGELGLALFLLTSLLGFFWLFHHRELERALHKLHTSQKARQGQQEQYTWLQSQQEELQTALHRFFSYQEQELQAFAQAEEPLYPSLDWPAAATALHERIAEQTQQLQEKLRQVERKGVLACHPCALPQLLAGLPGYLEERSIPLPKVLIAPPTPAHELVCQPTWLYESLLALLRQLPLDPHRVVLVKSFDTTLSYPMLHGQALPAVAFTLQQGVGIQGGAQIKPSYAYLAFPPYTYLPPLVRQVHARYGVVEQLKGGEARLLVLPLRLPSTGAELVLRKQRNSPRRVRQPPWA